MEAALSEDAAEEAGGPRSRNIYIFAARIVQRATNQGKTGGRPAENTHLNKVHIKTFRFISAS